MLLRVLFGKTPEVDEVYIFDDENQDNPFIEERDKILVKVLDVKDGWVKYIHVNGSCGIEHKRVRMFRALFKLYKK